MVITRRISIRRSRVTILVAAALALAGCHSSTEVTTGVTVTEGTVSSLSFTLDPSSVTVSPGGSGLTFGTILGASGLTLSFSVDQLPSGVSVRVTSDMDREGASTKKVIVFADAATVPGTYAANIRLTATNRPDTLVPFTVIVVGVR